MKKDKELFDLIKSAIVEALVEFTNVGVAPALEVPEELTPTPEPPKEDEDESGKGGASEESSGGGLNNGRPIPDAGVGAFSLRD